MKAGLIILGMIAYIAFFWWASNQELQDRMFNHGGPKRWYEDSSLNCYNIWISMIGTGIILSPIGLLMGYVLGLFLVP